MIYSAPWELVPPPRLDQAQTRRTIGMWAYRYNGHFFRSYLPRSADPNHAAQYVANRIPRDYEKRKEWMGKIISLIENELLWRAERGIQVSEPIFPDFGGIPPFGWESYVDIALDHPVDNRQQIAFTDIVPDHDLDWLRPLNLVQWSYVVDLEDYAFTINGILHFSFDQMPQDISECLVHPTTSSVYYKMTPKAEELYSTFVQRWPPQFCTPSEDLVNSYNLLSPTVVDLEKWCTRTWDELNTSESLSVHLVTTILRDQATQIRNPDILDDRRMFSYCQWQLITVAAPSATVVLPLPAPTDLRAFSPHINIGLGSGDLSTWKECEYSDPSDWSTPPPMWFRGCLVMLCYRLDTTAFVKAEVYRMVQNLKASHRGEGIGLIFDGRNVVGVALDDTQVQHSPALPIYNHQLKLTDGFRLMIHLLNPYLLADKVPWRPSASPPTRSNLHLPMEIVLRIIQFVDYDTYSVLPLVSYAFRFLYFTYPRLGDAILLRPTQGGAFHIFSTTTQKRYCAYLNRRMIDCQDSGFKFYHRQPKLGPTFFTSQEYAFSRALYRKDLSRNHQMQLLWSPRKSNIVHLGLRILDAYTPDFDEPLIPKNFEVLMQVILGAWTFDAMEDAKETEVWYRHHVARATDSGSDRDHDTYFEPIASDEMRLDQ